MTIRNLSKFNDENEWRWYQDQDTKDKFLSVTTIIDLGIPKKSKEEYFKKNTKATIEKQFKAAGEFGTQAHFHFERVLRGEEFEVPSTHVQHIEVFKKWIADHSVKATYIEQVLYSDKYRFAGTCDFIGEIDGKLFVADWKTSRRYDISFGYQMAAYRSAAIEMGLIDNTAGMLALKIDRVTAEPQSFEYTHYDFCFHKFLCAFELAKGINYKKMEKEGFPYWNIPSLQVI